MRFKKGNTVTLSQDAREFIKFRFGTTIFGIVTDTYCCVDDCVVVKMGNGSEHHIPGKYLLPAKNQQLQFGFMGH